MRKQLSYVQFQASHKETLLKETDRQRQRQTESDRDRLGLVLLLVLLGTAALQFFAWSRLEGYQLADSVEYMDRAWAVARGEALDPSTIRSFAFSALLLPIFAVAE